MSSFRRAARSYSRRRPTQPQAAQPPQARRQTRQWVRRYEGSQTHLYRNRARMHEAIQQYARRPPAVLPGVRQRSQAIRGSQAPRVYPPPLQRGQWSSLGDLGSGAPAASRRRRSLPASYQMQPRRFRPSGHRPMQVPPGSHGRFQQFGSYPQLALDTALEYLSTNNPSQLSQSDIDYLVSFVERLGYRWDLLTREPLTEEDVRTLRFLAQDCLEQMQEVTSRQQALGEQFGREEWLEHDLRVSNTISNVLRGLPSQISTNMSGDFYAALYAYLLYVRQSIRIAFSILARNASTGAKQRRTSSWDFANYRRDVPRSASPEPSAQASAAAAFRIQGVAVTPDDAARWNSEIANHAQRLREFSDQLQIVHAILMSSGIEADHGIQSIAGEINAAEARLATLQYQLQFQHPEETDAEISRIGVLLEQIHYDIYQAEQTQGQSLQAATPKPPVPPPRRQKRRAPSPPRAAAPVDEFAGFDMPAQQGTQTTGRPLPVLRLRPPPQGPPPLPSDWYSTPEQPERPQWQQKMAGWKDDEGAETSTGVDEPYVPGSRLRRRTTQASQPQPGDQYVMPASPGRISRTSSISEQGFRRPSVESPGRVSRSSSRGQGSVRRPSLVERALPEGDDYGFPISVTERRQSTTGHTPDSLAQRLAACRERANRLNAQADVNATLVSANEQLDYLLAIQGFLEEEQQNDSMRQIDANLQTVERRLNNMEGISGAAAPRLPGRPIESGGDDVPKWELDSLMGTCYSAAEAAGALGENLERDLAAFPGNQEVADRVSLLENFHRTVIGAFQELQDFAASTANMSARQRRARFEEIQRTVNQAQQDVGDLRRSRSNSPNRTPDRSPTRSPLQSPAGSRPGSPRPGSPRPGVQVHEGPPNVQNMTQRLLTRCETARQTIQGIRNSVEQNWPEEEYLVNQMLKMINDCEVSENRLTEIEQNINGAAQLLQVEGMDPEDIVIAVEDLTRQLNDVEHELQQMNYYFGSGW